MLTPLPSIFLSYARGDDEPFVRRLCDDLTDAGFEVWFDRDDLRSQGLTFHQKIRDAIDACDRLILIVGPRAAESEYVRQEWQYAWFDRAKVVTPILRTPRGKEPANDDYDLIPQELRLLHCDDFRDDDRYASELAKLLKSLHAPPPKLGQLIGVPSLPQRYLSRGELLISLREAVRAGLDSPAPLGGTTAHRKLSGIIGRERMAGMAGMGGIGKSVLALLLAHDRFVREAFPDGIVWVALGSSPNVVELLRRVCRDVGGDGAFEDEHAGKRQLTELLADKSALLILDDAWERKHVEAFDALGPTCRALITTRHAQLVTSLGGTPHLVDVLTDDEALRLLAATVRTELGQLPPEATRLIRECGRLALAVALAGGMIAAGQTWANLLKAFERHKLAFFKDDQRDNQHRDLLRTIEVSVEALPTEEQARLIELGVFPEDETVPEAAVACLWQRTGKLDDLDASALLVDLKQRSLLRLTKSEDDAAETVGRVSLHDLIYDYCLLRAGQQFGSESALHERLLDAYRAKCPDGWSTGPDDGYFFERLVYHLSEAKQRNEAERTVTDFRWLMRKCELGLLDSISNDYRELIKHSPKDVGQRLQVWQDFFREKAHILRRGLADASTHKILLQLALEHADDSPLTQAAEAWLAEDRCDWLRLQRVPRPERLTKNACLIVLEGHVDPVSGALSLPDDRLVSWSTDKSLQVWNATTGARVALLLGHESSVTGALSLPNGRLVSWSDDRTLRIWDAENGAALSILEGHADRVSGAQSLPDGRLLSWSHDGTLRVWDVANGTCRATLIGHTDIVWGARLLPDGRFLSWSADATLRLWDAESGACRAVFEGHASSVFGAVSLPQDRLLSWSYDKTLRVWLAGNETCRAILKGHTGYVSGAIPLLDGRILSWSEDKTFRVWDAENGACMAILKDSEHYPGGAIPLPNGRLLSWSDGKTLQIWDASRGTCLTALEGHRAPVCGASAMPNGRIVSWSQDKTLRVWDGASGACLAVLEGHTAQVSGAVSLPDGKLLSWSKDRTVRLWDVSRATCPLMEERRTASISGATSLRDGRIVSWSADALRVWDGATGMSLVVLEGHSSWINGALSLPDGRIVSWAWDQTLRVWDADSGTCLAVLDGHTLWISGALWLPNGRILSWSADKTLRVWDAENGACLAVLKGHRGRIYGALSLPNGRLLSWSEDKELRLWDAESGACLEALSEQEIGDMRPEWLEARRVVQQPSSAGGLLADAAAWRTRCTAYLRHRAVSLPLASWQAEADAKVLRLLPDGTLVASQADFDVCILKLWRGRRRVSLAETEESVDLDAEAFPGEA